MDSIVKKYIEVGEKLPGLVNTKSGEEDSYALPEDALVIYVYSYFKDSLGLKILNGTEEDIEIPEAYKLINADTDAVLLEENALYAGRVSGHSRDEWNIRLKERLQEGSYKILFGDREILFEIR